MATTIERVTEAIEAMREIRNVMVMWETHGTDVFFPYPVTDAIKRIDKFFEDEEG